MPKLTTINKFAREARKIKYKFSKSCIKSSNFTFLVVVQCVVFSCKHGRNIRASAEASFRQNITGNPRRSSGLSGFSTRSKRLGEIPRIDGGSLEEAPASRRDSPNRAVLPYSLPIFLSRFSKQFVRAESRTAIERFGAASFELSRDNSARYHAPSEMYSQGVPYDLRLDKNDGQLAFYL